MASDGGTPTGTIYREGDRCHDCGHWYWERDGKGWHSLVPITFADHPEAATEVICSSCLMKDES